MGSAATVDTTQPPFRVLSFGGGVQTVAIAAAWLFDSLLLLREPGWEHLPPLVTGPPPDLVIFADTQCEPPAVMRAVEEVKNLCTLANVRFETVSFGDLSKPQKSRTGVQQIFVPVYTTKLYSDADGPAGKQGQLLRQCTGRYKIEPIEARARELAGNRPIEIVLGISLEEAHRMKRRGEDEGIQNYYPLVYENGLGGMTRNDCVRYLDDLHISSAKSACFMCPYRRDAYWIAMYRNEPALFARAVEYDRWVRDQRPGYQCFIHDSRRPLENVVPERAAVADQQSTLFPIDLDFDGPGGCDGGHCGT